MHVQNLDGLFQSQWPVSNDDLQELQNQIASHNDASDFQEYEHHPIFASAVRINEEFLERAWIGFDLIWIAFCLSLILFWFDVVLIHLTVSLFDLVLI